MADNRAAIEAFFAAFNRGDMATMHALLAPDVEFHEAPSLPYGGVFRGANGWDELASKVLGTWRDLVVTPEYVIGGPSDTRFAAMHHFVGKNQVGEKFDTHVFEMWRIEDGLVREVQVHYYDTAEMARLARAA